VSDDSEQRAMTESEILTVCEERQRAKKNDERAKKVWPADIEWRNNNRQWQRVKTTTACEDNDSMQRQWQRAKTTTASKDNDSKQRQWQQAKKQMTASEDQQQAKSNDSEQRSKKQRQWAKNWQCAMSTNAPTDKWCPTSPRWRIRWIQPPVAELCWSTAVTRKIIKRSWQFVRKCGRRGTDSFFGRFLHEKYKFLLDQKKFVLSIPAQDPTYHYWVPTTYWDSRMGIQNPTDYCRGGGPYIQHIEPTVGFQPDTYFP